MNIHVVWTQGWDLAPPAAIRNSKSWDAVGRVVRWSEESAVASGLVDKATLDLAMFPAMKADIILAHAMKDVGGMAVGADMVPLNIEAIRLALNESERLNHGMVVYQSYKDEPYSGASYFPIGHKWPQLVCEQQRLNVIENGSNKNVCSVTGPRMWRLLMRKHPGLFWSSIRTIPAWIAFSYEPKTRGTHRDAWINPGLTGDWLGVKRAQWN